MLQLNRFFMILTISFFFLLISVPLVAFFFQDQKKISAVEKRALAPKPALPAGMQALSDYPRQFEEYYSDHFGFRDSFLDLYALGKRLIGDTLGVNVGVDGGITRNVIKGKRGWYFLNRVWDGDPLSDYRNLDLYSPAELLRAGISIAARKHWLEKQGIRYLLFFAPNKHTIYSEYLPDYIVKQGNVSSMDQLYGFLAEYTSVDFVDLRDVLIRGKARAPDYWPEGADDARLHWKTDSHWNSGGADIAQYEVARRMEKMLPGLIMPRQRPVKDFQMIPITGDLASLMNDKTLYGEKGPVIFEGVCSPATRKEYQKRYQVTSCSQGKVNALIFHDSFFTALKPFFADYFATTVFMWERLNQEALLTNIAQHRPAIVIEQLAERFLPYLPDISGEAYNDFWGAVYERSGDTIYRLDGRQISRGKKGRDNFNVSLTFDRQSKVLAISAQNRDPHIYLPAISFQPGQAYIAKVEIEVPGPTRMQIFYSRQGAESGFPSENDSARYSLQKGDNTLFIPLLSGDLGYRLRLDPGTMEGSYRLREFTVRAFDKTHLQ